MEKFTSLLDFDLKRGQVPRTYNEILTDIRQGLVSFHDAVSADADLIDILRRYDFPGAAKTLEQSAQSKDVQIDCLETMLGSLIFLERNGDAVLHQTLLARRKQALSSGRKKSIMLYAFITFVIIGISVTSWYQGLTLGNTVGYGLAVQDMGKAGLIKVVPKGDLVELTAIPKSKNGKAPVTATLSAVTLDKAQ